MNLYYTKLRLFFDVMYHFHPNRLPHLFEMYSNCHSDSLSSTIVCPSIRIYVVGAVVVAAAVAVEGAAGGVVA